MSDNTLRLGVDLSKYPTLARFSMSDALIRVIIGPAGSLKTSLPCRRQMHAGFDIRDGWPYVTPSRC